MRSLRRQILISAISIMLCISMLLGTTYAWFTDTATSKDNIITSGKLDAEMYYSDTLLPADSTEWKNADGEAVFTYDNWEPNYTDVKYIKVKNAGNLSFKWRLSIEKVGTMTDLAEVIEVFYINPVGATVETLDGLTSVGWLSDVVADHTATEGVLLPDGQTKAGVTTGEVILAVVLHMDEEADNHYMNKSIGDGFALSLVATQYTYEKDAFGDSFDTNAQWPNNIIIKENSASAAVNKDASGRTTAQTNLTSRDGQISGRIPAGVLMTDSATEATLRVGEMAKSEANITLDSNEATLSINVHIDGVSEDNEVVMEITIKALLPVGLNMGNYRFYHVEDGNTVAMTLLENGATPVHNNFTYNPATGDTTLYLKSFSEVALVANNENAWKGTFDYSWYDSAKTELTIANADQLAAFGAIVGGMNGQTQDSFAGKTVKLLADINLGDKESENNPDLIFYPIGYYNSEGTYDRTNTAITSGFRNFEGTFDGNGNTISNFYQNTWEMKGDHDWYDATLQYYRDGMGLFGKVYGGTVKNLTVSNFSSDGEIATTGVIAAYADGATFENITIFNCNPRVYNIGNGGIVGCVGWYAKEADMKTTFTNITVDNSNKISALWGSYDVACGGIVGQYYPTSGQTSAGTPKNGGLDFVNCHVSAVMDVYNDVCANYQYYAYRYAGMIIGSIRENTKNDQGKTIPDMTGISATGCTVNYGDWNDYYYCEFEKNGHPSYSGADDYKFSRVPHSELNFTDSNGNGLVDADERASVTGCKHNHTDAENNQAIYLPFHQLFTGYGWGVNSIGLEKYSGIVTNLDITEGETEASVEKFETKFTGDFLYRVGNQNPVAIGALFAAKDGVTISNAGVWVKVEAVNEDANVSGSFKANTTDWTKGTIQFSGTGVVKVTIQDYNFCIPTVLYVEVIDAVNATSATSATENNVVLLQNCGFSSLEVSGGYTLFGNGFTLTCSQDSYATDRQYAFVELKGGTLDNVQIVVPNFSHALMYEKNKTENGNPNYTDSSGKTRYYNIRSAVLVSANSKITNSYISGGRAAIYATSGTLTIENSTIYGGAVANIQAEASSHLILKDATLIQKPIQANVNDTSKTLMGLSVLLMCDTTGNGAPVTLQGYLHQFAWANNDYKQYVPSDAQSVVEEVLGNTDYVHSITYADGVTRDSVNLGFAYMPDGTTATNANNMIDTRSDVAEMPYDKVIVSTIAVIYTYKNTNGTDNAVKTEPSYTASTQGGIIIPTVKYEDANENRVFTTTYDTTKAQWKSTLKVDVDAGEYSFSFAKLLAQKYGINLNYVVKTEDGTPVDKNAVITLNSAVSNVYILTITDNQIYDKNGNLTGETAEITYTFELLATKPVCLHPRGHQQH